MLRIALFSGLLAASLAGAAIAAEQDQHLVNRPVDAAAVQTRNLVGGSHRNADGTVSPIYQGNQHSPIDNGLYETPAASYQGW